MCIRLRRVLLVTWLVTLAVLVAAVPARAQATSTFVGRVLDQGDAVLPGVTVTATSTSTGVVRTAVTNGEGAYYLPGLDPGAYDVKAELTGFGPRTRERVTLDINATITLDFQLALAGVSEAVTVTGAAPLIEVTQSKVASTIEATELQNLPMITRTVSGMLALLPGAAPMAPMHRSKENVGTVSYAGASGTNVVATVDGADNRDNHYGGPLMNLTTDSLEQFQLATSQFTAADGRTSGAAVTMVTKSGTNVLHGTAFLFARDRAMTAKDYFTKQANGEKIPFSRQQFGGSVGGPFLRNRLFFFGAVEQVLEDTSEPIPDNLYNEKQVLVTATAAGLLPPGLVNPNHPRFGPLPAQLTMYSFKTNGQLNNDHSLMLRFAGTRDSRDNDNFSVANDLREPQHGRIRMWSTVGQHNWVMGSRGLNQITGQVSHNRWLSGVESVITGEHYTRDFPNVAPFPTRLSFPSVNTGAGGAGGSQSHRYLFQVRDDVSWLAGNHALKTGANYNRFTKLGVRNLNEHFPTHAFFDDPSVIFSNSNGRYPQGFSTPGIVRMWQQANVGSWADGEYDTQQVMAWFQDDWRATPRFTLNLGVRYDLDLNFYDQEHYENNATRLVLEAIDNRYGGLAKTPTKNISPRVGFAYDVSGTGQRVLRGGYGLYFDQYTTSVQGDLNSQNKRPLNALATLTNTAIGVGQLATYRFGIDPPPPTPTEGNSLPRGSTGQWRDPDFSDPLTHQMHIGYAHELASNTTLAVDYTHIEGLHGLRDLEINPIVDGVRVLAPEFMRVYGYPNPLNGISIKASNSESRYDALTFKLQRRIARTTLQAHYTLAGARAFGGSWGGRQGATFPQDAFDPYAEGEWGPTSNDERHRVVVMGVFELPYGIQLSPLFQAATARPYTLTAGSDLNRDGRNNDRYVDPADRRGGLGELPAGRRDNVAGPARNQVRRARRRPPHRLVCRVLQCVQHLELWRQLQRQRSERGLPPAKRVSPEHRLPAPVAARGAVSLLSERDFTRGRRGRLKPAPTSATCLPAEAGSHISRCGSASGAFSPVASAFRRKIE